MNICLGRNSDQLPTIDLPLADQIAKVTEEKQYESAEKNIVYHI